jgi:hypothetical protein
MSRASAILCPHERSLYDKPCPPSKLCVREAILGSDSISYTLVSQVDMYGKLQSRSTHSEDCCGENCLETRRILLHGLDPQFTGRYEYIERKLNAQD